VTTDSASFDPDGFGPEWRSAFEFVEASVGGRVVSAEREPRWRPNFWLEVERPGGERLPICFRGARIEQGEENTISHEYACFRVLERNGIPVPRIYGLCEDPVGIVMERAPGRHDLATAASTEERDAVRDHFIEILARIHALPIADFEAAGLPRRTTPRALGLGDSAQGIARFRSRQTRPDPIVEFLIDWCERHVPEHRRDCTFVTGDSGQFLFDQGRVTAMLDMELGYLGDPLADLGGLFCRDLTESMGDLDVAIDRYAMASGRPVDRRVVLYHAIRFALTTPLGTALSLAAPHVAVEYVQYLTWYLVYARCPLELIAYREGIALEPPALPDERVSPYAVAHDSLQQKFDAFATHDAFQAYEADSLRRLALVLRQGDRYGADLMERDLDDAEVLLGFRPADWQARDMALSDLIGENRGERDAELVRYLVRRIQREEAILAPAQRDLVGARMQTIRLD
jgi:hypothetical protein